MVQVSGLVCQGDCPGHTGGLFFGEPCERKVTTMARAMTMDDEVREKFQAVSIKMPPDLIRDTRSAANANEESFARLVRRAIRQELASMKRSRKRSGG